MEKVRPWCSQLSDRGRLKNITERLPATKVMKGNAKLCKKILVLSHTLGDLGVTHGVRLWLDGLLISDN